MMRRDTGYRLWVTGLAVLLLTACGPQSPQRPSRRMGEAPQADSTQLALMEFNQQMAKTADEQLRQIALAQDETYALYTGGAWATILEHGDLSQPRIKMGEEREIHMRTYSLDGRLLEDSEGIYMIGKLELPRAVDANIPDWHPGSKIRMYAPWYSAYGMKGTAHIPPYENVLIEIKLR